MWTNEASAEQSNSGANGQLAVIAPAAPAPYAPALATLGGGLDVACDVPSTLMERIELCKFLTAANLLPRALQDAPANVLLIMHKAMALSIPLSVAIEHLHVIDGKIGHSAELLRALLHRHGHVLRWPEISDKQVIGELVLRHDPRNPRKEKFTIADASRMELTNKANWKKDPASMMVARCSTRLVSRHCPEVALALGNLSAIDFEDEAPVTASHAEPGLVGLSKEQQAVELLVEAKEAVTTEELKEIGGRARDLGLLDIAVEGCDSLQSALLRRIQQLSEARETARENA